LGPLPSSDFSFGAPSTTPPMASPYPGDSECDSPEANPILSSYPFPAQQESDLKDRTGSAMYLPRFGSIASLASSESSNTSSYLSDIGSTEFDIDVRGGSTTSGHEGGQFSGTALVAHAFISHESSGGLIDGGISHGSNSYPSPSSTISPGPSPHHHGESPILPISRSSELAFALQANEELIQPNDGLPSSKQEVDRGVSPENGPVNFYPRAPEQEHVYTHQSSTSTLNVPMLAYPAPAYTTTIPPYPDSNFVGEAQNIDLISSVQFPQGTSPDIYNAFHGDAAELSPPGNIHKPFVSYS